MEETQFNNVIGELGKLTGIVQEGFRAVHQRQDYANGRLTKHEDRLNKIDTMEALTASDVKEIKNKSGESRGEKSKWIDRGLMLLIGIILQGIVLVLIRTNIIDVTPAPKTQADVAQRLIELEAQTKQLNLQVQENKK